MVLIQYKSEDTEDACEIDTNRHHDQHPLASTGVNIIMNSNLDLSNRQQRQQKRQHNDYNKKVENTSGGGVTKSILRPSSVRAVAEEASANVTLEARDNGISSSRHSRNSSRVSFVFDDEQNKNDGNSSTSTTVTNTSTSMPSTQNNKSDTAAAAAAAEKILIRLGISEDDLQTCRRLTIIKEGARQHYYRRSNTGSTTTSSSSNNSNDNTRGISYSNATNKENATQRLHHHMNYRHKWCVVKNPFPVTALTALLKRAPKLVCLEVCRIRLDGTIEDFQDLADTIEYNNHHNTNCLRAFSLEHCRINDKQVAQQNALEIIVRALVDSPIMGDITLIADKDFGLGSLSVETIELLAQTPRLLVLRLDKLGLHDEQIAALAHVLKRNEVLRTLKLSCRSIGYLGSVAILKMLQRNVGSLEKFYLFIEKVTDEDATVQIAHALQTSTTLKNFDLGFGNPRKLSPRLQQIHVQVLHSKALANKHEVEFSSTKLSRCPFIRLLQYSIDGCVYLGGGSKTDSGVATAKHDNASDMEQKKNEATLGGNC